MSNAKERGRLEDIVSREFQEYAGALTRAGHDWEAVWETAAWPPGADLRWLHGRFLLAWECAGAAGLRLTNKEIARLYREHLAYLEQFPGGMPVL